MFSGLPWQPSCFHTGSHRGPLGTALWWPQAARVSSILAGTTALGCSKGGKVQTKMIVPFGWIFPLGVLQYCWSGCLNCQRDQPRSTHPTKVAIPVKMATLMSGDLEEGVLAHSRMLCQATTRAVLCVGFGVRWYYGGKCQLENSYLIYALVISQCKKRRRRGKKPWLNSVMSQAFFLHGILISSLMCSCSTVVGGRDAKWKLQQTTQAPIEKLTV